MNYELTQICTDNISKYLEFNISKIFDRGDYIAIFGGAVRDSLAQKEIHDVDIMCLPESARKLANYLTNELDFLKVDLYDQHQLAMYREIRFINEPWTFIKDKKIIQIIRPAGGAIYNGEPTMGSLIDSYYAVLSDVDISCCGVFLERERDGIIRLKESHPHAITHCRSHTYEVLKNNRMFGEMRTDIRQFKLSDRGWKNLSNNKDIKVERRVKLYGLQKPMYPYKSYKPSKKSLEEEISIDDLFGL